MSDQQTQCPQCSAIYKVTVAQLTVAQGMVCCPKCSHSFNALLHLVQIQVKHLPPQLKIQEDVNLSTNNLQNIESSSNLLSIFSRKVEHSNIDLETYLNNLNYFNTEPLKIIPMLNLAADKAYTPKKKNHFIHYVILGIINIIIISVIIFQILIRNPQLLSYNSAVDTTFHTLCDLFSCSSQEQQYALIDIHKIQIHLKDRKRSILSGELVNKNKQSLKNPRLLITLYKDGKQIFKRIYPANDYLIPSLKNVERIPKNSPFKFNIQLPLPANSFDDYDLQIIQP